MKKDHTTGAIQYWYDIWERINWFRFLSSIYRKVSGYLKLALLVEHDSVSVQEFSEIKLNGTGGHKKQTKYLRHSLKVRKATKLKKPYSLFSLIPFMSRHRKEISWVSPNQWVGFQTKCLNLFEINSYDYRHRTNVADSHHFGADPDPTFHFHADPDPTLHAQTNPDPTFHAFFPGFRPSNAPKWPSKASIFSLADPDPAFQLWWIRIQLSTLMRIRIHNNASNNNSWSCIFPRIQNPDPPKECESVFANKNKRTDIIGGLGIGMPVRSIMCL